MEVIKIRTIEELTIDTLIEESLKEGFSMLEELLSRYQDTNDQYLAKNEALLVAVDEYGRYLGIASLRDNHGKGEVGNLYVLPHYRKMGVAYEIINWLLKIGEDYYSSLVLEGPVSKQALKFFEKRGFQEKDTEQIFVYRKTEAS